MLDRDYEATAGVIYHGSGTETHYGVALIKADERDAGYEHPLTPLVTFGSGDVHSAPNAVYQRQSR
jgi:hypothetical protein